jgi:asparagine synthase (glutamine-hydrolysing)
MCGIVGFVNADGRSADRGILGRMNDAIRHRGPDDDGVFVHEAIAIGMRRLAIIDIGGGNQPMFSSDRRYSIVFNGEIYNFLELRERLESEGERFETDSDTEVLLRLFERRGPGCLSDLRGMFAFAVWDAVEKSLFIARDRVGKKPLLYSHLSNGDLIFGSEFQSLLKHPGISREIDPDAIDSYMSFLAVPAPRTAFRDIRKLEPAHWMRWKSGQIHIERYWQPDFSKKISIGEAEAVEETTRILSESTLLRMISDVPLGAFLSGGVDSSIVAALMAKETHAPIKTFSIGFEEQDYSELKYARMVARHIGAEPHEFVVRPNALELIPTLVDHYGEPYADSSAIPTYYVARETRKHVTVALNGDGGDESFAGYERHAAMLIAEWYRRIPNPLRKIFIESIVSILPGSELKRSRFRDLKRFIQAANLPLAERYFRWTSSFPKDELDFLYTDSFKESLTGAGPQSVQAEWLEAKSENSRRGILDSVLLTDLMTYLPTDLLVKVDIATMANSLEGRSPFLDHKVIEFAASLPENIKMSRFQTKSLLKKVAANLVPREAVYRKKMGFGVPVGDWFRGEMKGFVKEVLLSEKSLNRGVIRPEMLRRYVNEHTSAEKDHSFKLWTLLMLELWFERIVDQ